MFLMDWKRQYFLTIYGAYRWNISLALQCTNWCFLLTAELATTYANGGMDWLVILASSKQYDKFQV